ncbi:LacI family DNA-binding transcriptional regulator [Leifsonia shinshuensis]|uniref:LacI family transcriptional regulator n=1 Tax=Leifsonia shinshuensis TaxID=150026 RepID=A0A853CRZ3_9MICO|nr:LacI family DNA-binding transcriptional regulator [Leifsonia shinshuensis]NYJ22241.1 LacI family transcriptional regulator [Leifsonia shinshuensis]
MTGDKLPTMQAVAEKAGVSLATVSNVMNQPSRVAPATRDRVRAAIESLGYIRNAAARDLKRSRSDGIGLIVPDILNRLFVDMARGAQITAGQRGLSLLLANAVYAFESFDPLVVTDQQDQFLDFFAEERTSGILYAAMSDPTDGINRIRGHVRPIVVINYDQPGDWCSVLMDNRQAGRIAVEHLAGIGVRRVFYVSPPDAAQPIADRRRGVAEGAASQGLELTEVTTDGLEFEHGSAAMAELLAGRADGERIGFVGMTDALALGALGVLREHPELRIPEDVAVIGLDGTHDGARSDWVSLTSITLPGYRMGEEAIRLVLDEAQPGHRHERVILPVGMRLGASTLGSAATAGGADGTTP